MFLRGGGGWIKGFMDVGNGGSGRSCLMKWKWMFNDFSGNTEWSFEELSFEFREVKAFRDPEIKIGLHPLTPSSIILKAIDFKSFSIQLFPFVFNKINSRKSGSNKPHWLHPTLNFNKTINLTQESLLKKCQPPLHKIKLSVNLFLINFIKFNLIETFVEWRRNSQWKHQLTAKLN